MKTLVFTIAMLLAGQAHAGCYYNGYTYPTGTIINGLTCQSDGSWR